MTDTKDRRYFRARAEAEIEAASASDNTAAVQAHYQLAELYLERVFPPEAANDAEHQDADADIEHDEAG